MASGLRPVLPRRAGGGAGSPRLGPSGGDQGAAGMVLPIHDTAVDRLMLACELEPEDAQEFAVQAQRVEPESVVRLRVGLAPHKVRHSLVARVDRRIDDERLATARRDRGQGADRIAQVFEEGPDQHHVKQAEISGQGVDIAVVDQGLGGEEPMRQPVGLLPAHVARLPLRHPGGMIGHVQAVRKGQQVLPGDRIHVHRDDRRAGGFGAEGEKAGGAADIEDAAAGEGDVAHIVGKLPAQVPQACLRG